MRCWTGQLLLSFSRSERQARQGMIRPDLTGHGTTRRGERDTRVSKPNAGPTAHCGAQGEKSCGLREPRSTQPNPVVLCSGDGCGRPRSRFASGGVKLRSKTSRLRPVLASVDLGRCGVTTYDDAVTVDERSDRVRSRRYGATLHMRLSIRGELRFESAGRFGYLTWLEERCRLTAKKLGRYLRSTTNWLEQDDE